MRLLSAQSYCKVVNSYCTRINCGKKERLFPGRKQSFQERQERKMGKWKGGGSGDKDGEKLKHEMDGGKEGG